MELMIEIGPVQVNEERLAELCRQYSVQELSLFGSMARGDNRPDSDIDILVLFQPDARISLLEYARLMDEFAGPQG